MKNKKWLSSEKLYNVYRGMKSRCYYKKDNRYKNYGGRGIKVCDEWKNNYLKFKEWALKNGYDENAKFGKCSLDRIDVSRNYEPSNCRWVDYKIQANNRTNNTLITYKGKTNTIANWSRITGISVNTLIYRYKNNWNIEKMLFLKPVVGRNQWQKNEIMRDETYGKMYNA